MFIFQYFLVKLLFITISWYAFVLTVKGKEKKLNEREILLSFLEDKIQLEKRTKQEYDFCKFANVVQIIEAYSKKNDDGDLSFNSYLSLWWLIFELWWVPTRHFYDLKSCFSCKLEHKKVPKINVSIAWLLFIPCIPPSSSVHFHPN